MPNENRSPADLGWRFLREQANVVMLELTPAGIIRQANAYAATLTGIALPGRSLRDLIVDSSPQFRRIAGGNRPKRRGWSISGPLPAFRKPSMPLCGRWRTVFCGSARWIAPNRNGSDGNC
jgi:hypothetical protein